MSKVIYMCSAFPVLDRFAIDGSPAAAPEVSPLSVGPGTLYPVGMTIDRAVALYWRLKDCQFLVDAAFLFSGDDLPITDDLNITASVPAPRWGGFPTDETALPEGLGGWRANFSFSQDIGGEQTADGGGAVSALEGDDIFGNPGALPPIVRVQDTYYPQMIGSLTFAITLGSFIHVSSFREDDMEACNIALVVADFDIQTYFRMVNLGGVDIQPNGGSIRLAPVSYWEYDDGSGPVYDGATGNVLRPECTTLSHYIERSN